MSDETRTSPSELEPPECHCQVCDPEAFRAMLGPVREGPRIDVATSGHWWHVYLDGVERRMEAFAAEAGEHGWVASFPGGHGHGSHKHRCARCLADGRRPGPCMELTFGRVVLVPFTAVEHDHA